MSIKAVLFDLDGTLLPLEQNAFMKVYFGGLAKKLAPKGYDPKALVDAVWAGSAAMVKNDGSRRNEEIFWDRFAELLGEQIREEESLLDEYYHNEFQLARSACGFDPRAKAAVEKVKALGLRPVLATNPLFPAIATETRARWAGVEPSDFELYTTYENAGFCKPNPAYYKDLANRLNLRPEECLMVGNDVDEDMIAETIGMKVFLLTDCLINRGNKDISAYPSGGFDELLAYLDTLNA